MLWTLLAAVIGYFAAKHLLIKRDSPNTVGLLGFTIIVLAIAANTLFSMGSPLGSVRDWTFDSMETSICQNTKRVAGE